MDAHNARFHDNIQNPGDIKSPQEAMQFINAANGLFRAKANIMLTPKDQSLADAIYGPMLPGSAGAPAGQAPAKVTLDELDDLIRKAGKK